MTIRTFLVGSLISILISWGIWFLIVLWLDPVTAGPVGFVLFFLATFLSVASFATLVGYSLRRFFLRGQLPAYSVRPALRQGIWLGLFMDVLLFLQLLRLLHWWMALIIILLFLSLELLFLSYDRNNRKTAASPRGSQYRS